MSVLGKCAVICLLVCCCSGCSNDDDGVVPHTMGTYEIQGAFFLDEEGNQGDWLVGASIRRLDSSDPSPLDCTATVDGHSMELLRSSTEDWVHFSFYLPSHDPGDTHRMTLSLQGKTAACSLVTPQMVSSCTILAPGDSSTYSPGEPLQIDWQTSGFITDEVYFYAYGFPSDTTQVSAYGLITLPGAATTVTVPADSTATWSTYRWVDCYVQGNNTYDFAGELASPQSICRACFWIEGVRLLRP